MESELPGYTEAERNMAAGGVSVDEPAVEDYFGFDETGRYVFPDGKQYIEYRVMDEGMRARFQKATSRDIRLFKTSGDASVKINPAEEREILLLTSVIGWNLLKNGEPVSFGPVPASVGSPFGQWLQHANPKYVAELELAIRKANVWMNAELTVEAIDAEIASMQEMRAEAVKREEGKGVS